MPIKRFLTSAIILFAVLSAHSQTLPADTIFFDDGSWYCGEIADSLFDGHGTMFYSDSTVYTGEWKAGLWNGQGSLTYPDGDNYTGTFLNHEFEGAGVYTYHNGAKYDGYWKESMFHGPGTFDYADGSTYTGLWENDRKEGIGVFYDARSNTLYKGMFHNDVFVRETDEYGRPVITEVVEPDEEPLVREFRFGAQYSTESNLSFNFDFQCSKCFYAGLSFGFNTRSHGKGLQAVEYNNETGERYVLVGWDERPDEIVMEHDYTMFHLLGECELSGNRIGMGLAAGIGVKSTIRDCRGLGGGYFEAGKLYYRQQISGVRFGYRVFSDIILKELTVSGNGIRIAARIGYGNLDGAFIGLDVCY